MRDLAPAAITFLEGGLVAVTFMSAGVPCSPPAVPLPLLLRRIGWLVQQERERRVLGEERDDSPSRMALAISPFLSLLVLLLSPCVAGGCGGERLRRRSPVRAPSSSSPPSRAC
ncbi:hypothetical protein ZWY2020_033881 [Hordeum vulgare]|nr:hypothetical protein ZWY2020_033881 [Hordeum vulgare]